MHLKQKAWIDNLNEHVPAGDLVYMLDVNYYGDAQQGVFERAGAIRSDVQTRYSPSRGFTPEEQRFCVQGTPRHAELLAHLGTVTDLGLGLFRVERKGLSLEAMPEEALQFASDPKSRVLPLWFTSIGLLVPAGWLLAFWSLVVRARLATGEWPHGRSGNFFEGNMRAETIDLVATTNFPRIGL